MQVGQALGERNPERERLLKFAVAKGLMVGNSWFKKRFENLVTYQSEDFETQIDYIFYKKSLRKMVFNVKDIVGKSVQHNID